MARDRVSYGQSQDLSVAPPSPAPSHVILSERESLDLLRAAGLAVTAAIAVPDADAAVEAALALGAHAVALKLDARDLAHKSDLGLVALSLAGDDQIRAAAHDLLVTGRRHGLEIRGLLVEPMAAPGLELIVGMRRDPSFGPVVMVGLGGVLAEVLDDVTVRLAPVPADEALAMLAELRGARILDGVRGRPAVDRDSVAALIVALSRVAMARPDIVEVDMNPVIASPDGAIAVDALVVVVHD